MEACLKTHPQKDQDNKVNTVAIFWLKSKSDILDVEVSCNVKFQRPILKKCFSELVNITNSSCSVMCVKFICLRGCPELKWASIENYVLKQIFNYHNYPQTV